MAGVTIVAPERPVLSSRFGRNRVVVYPRRSNRNRYHEGDQTISRDLRVNQMIRIPQVRVVDEEGAQLGSCPRRGRSRWRRNEAWTSSRSPRWQSPPVVKFLDFGQYKYDLTKREKEAKRKQRSVTFKEVRLSPKIGMGDFDTKVHRAIEFLEDGDRIKVTVRFRGRELTHPELGRNLLARFVDRVKDHGVAERTPLLEGKSMHITMASLHKPKAHDAPTRQAPTATSARPDSDSGGRPAARRRPSRRAPAPAADAGPRPAGARPERHAAPAAAGSGRTAEAPAPAAATGATERRPQTHAGPGAGDDRRVRPACPR